MWITSYETLKVCSRFLFEAFQSSFVSGIVGWADTWLKASLAFYEKLFAVREGPWATCCVAKQQFHYINNLAHSSWHVVAERYYCSNNGWGVWPRIFQSSEKGEMIKEIKKTWQTTATLPRSMLSLDELGLLLGGSKRGVRPKEKSQWSKIKTLHTVSKAITRE